MNAIILDLIGQELGDVPACDWTPDDGRGAETETSERGTPEERERRRERKVAEWLELPWWSPSDYEGTRWMLGGSIAFDAGGGQQARGVADEQTRRTRRTEKL
eukprot:GHVU01179337.1.p2 GENE.GHVU01179337.1~~GHVU01179337.1.p2  ORF type:complete len:103 (+),score=19.94 GHVU01179337.1:155-463(+)